MSIEKKLVMNWLTDQALKGVDSPSAAESDIKDADNLIEDSPLQDKYTLTTPERTYGFGSKLIDSKAGQKMVSQVGEYHSQMADAIESGETEGITGRPPEDLDMVPEIAFMRTFAGRRNEQFNPKDKRNIMDASVVDDRTGMLSSEWDWDVSGIRPGSANAWLSDERESDETKIGLEILNILNEDDLTTKEFQKLTGTTESGLLVKRGEDIPVTSELHPEYASKRNVDIRNLASQYESEVLSGENNIFDVVERIDDYQRKYGDGEGLNEIEKYNVSQNLSAKKDDQLRQHLLKEMFDEENSKWWLGKNIGVSSEGRGDVSFDEKTGRYYLKSMDDRNLASVDRSENPRYEELIRLGGDRWESDFWRMKLQFLNEGGTFTGPAGTMLWDEESDYIKKTRNKIGEGEY